uniref:Uncharacterized protein n=1 Tax=viral metagenome TaxID=1070528 RepID=A0A6C0C214_9ZZZZ
MNAKRAKFYPYTSAMKYAALASVVTASLATANAVNAKRHTNIPKDPDESALCIRQLPACNSRTVRAYQFDITEKIDRPTTTWRILSICGVHPEKQDAGSRLSLGLFWAQIIYIAT